MKNIYLLPTNEISKLYKIKGQLEFEKYPDKTVNVGNQYIYITSDEKIEYNDFIICEGSVAPLYVKEYLVTQSMLLEGHWKKIIITNDPKLIAKGIEEVSEDFLIYFTNQLFLDPDFKYVILLHKVENKSSNNSIQEAAIKNWGNAHRTGVLGFIDGVQWHEKQINNLFNPE